MRSYKRKRPGSRRGRMLLAARYRADGLSLRQIAERLEVHHETVRRDLSAWDAEQAKVSHLPVAKTPPGGGNATPECDSGTVVQFRKQA